MLEDLIRKIPLPIKIISIVTLALLFCSKKTLAQKKSEFLGQIREGDYSLAGKGLPVKIFTTKGTGDAFNQTEDDSLLATSKTTDYAFYNIIVNTAKSDTIYYMTVSDYKMFTNPEKTEHLIKAVSGVGANKWIDLYAADGVVVPVELASFTAESNLDDILLEWTTLSETNNSGFHVMRGKDKNNIDKKLAFIKTKSENGNSNKEIIYSYIDTGLASEKYFYQLIQQDWNGKQSYSNIIEAFVKAPDNFNLYQNYPNPFNPLTTIKFDLPEDLFVNLTIYNKLGQPVKTLINEYKQAGKHKIIFDAEELSSGMYLYRFRTKKFDKMERMILIK